MRKNLKKILGSIMLGGCLTFGLVGCGSSSSDTTSTAYLFFNGQYIKYNNVKEYNTNEDGTVKLKMMDGKEIKLYSPGNVTVVTKGAIPDQKQNKK